MLFKDLFRRINLFVCAGVMLFSVALIRFKQNAIFPKAISRNEIISKTDKYAKFFGFTNVENKDIKIIEHDEWKKMLTSYAYDEIDSLVKNEMAFPRYYVVSYYKGRYKGGSIAFTFSVLPSGRVIFFIGFLSSDFKLKDSDEKLLNIFIPLFSEMFHISPDKFSFDSFREFGYILYSEWNDKLDMPAFFAQWSYNSIKAYYRPSVAPISIGIIENLKLQFKKMAEASPYGAIVVVALFALSLLVFILQSIFILFFSFFRSLEKGGIRIYKSFKVSSVYLISYLFSSYLAQSAGVEDFMLLKFELPFFTITLLITFVIFFLLMCAADYMERESFEGRGTFVDFISLDFSKVHKKYSLLKAAMLASSIFTILIFPIPLIRYFVPYITTSHEGFFIFLMAINGIYVGIRSAIGNLYFSVCHLLWKKRRWVFFFLVIPLAIVFMYIAAFIFLFMPLYIPYLLAFTPLFFIDIKLFYLYGSSYTLLNNYFYTIIWLIGSMLFFNNPVYMLMGLFVLFLPLILFYSVERRESDNLQIEV